jgi:lipoyl(octanoyl) transferase
VTLTVVQLGTVPYATALDLQRATAHARISGQIADDVLLLVEHPPVVTLGRGTKPGHLVASEGQLQARGVELFEVERGGDVTFHGPGQLVGYPIIDLKRHRQDLHWYLRQVEEALIQALAALGLHGVRNPGYTGVWIEHASRITHHASRTTHHASPGSTAPMLRKIASIGVHARDWVTWHGFALNVTTDLSYFDLIVPCGISDVTMTTCARELGASFPGHAAVNNRVTESFGRVFGLEVSVASREWLEQRAAVPSGMIQSD